MYTFSISTPSSSFPSKPKTKKKKRDGGERRNKTKPRSDNGDGGRKQRKGGREHVVQPKIPISGPNGGRGLVIAGLVVEVTPDRNIKHNNKRRSVLQSKTPPTNSTRKRRARRSSSVSIVPVAVLDLDSEDETSNKESEKEKKEMEKKKGDVVVDKKIEVEESTTRMEPGVSAIPCMDRLREELSCAICLEICYEPSTTPCGHSFCKKCLQSAADKCGKRCPKCRQLISNGRSCTVNTVLWNTIQLLFPQEIEARKASAAVVECVESKSQSFETRTRTRGIHSLNGQEGEVQHTERRRRNHHFGNRIVRPSTESGEVRRSKRRREDLPVQDEDAALALRLQREEFMEAFRPTDDGQQQTSASLMLARANLRAMASRAINVRARGRQN